MITVAPGKHRRPKRQTMARDGLAAANQRTLLTDADWPPSEAGPWPQWEGPPPPLHPDHPSAPVPRVRTPLAPGADGARRAPDRSPSPGVPRSRPGDSGPPRGANARPQGPAVTQTSSGLTAPSTGAQSAGTVGFARQPGFGGGGRMAVIGEEPMNQAVAIRQAAEQDAAAIRQEATGIREAAEKDAEHLRTVILSLSEQLGQVSEYITENLASPGEAPTAPAAAVTAALVTAPQTALPTAGPATRPVRKVTGPTRPASRHARPVTKPGRSASRPTTGTQGWQARTARQAVALLARPVGLASPARQRTTPAQQTAGRQRKAMRIAAGATATLFAFAVITAGVEIGTFGPKFFVFREAGAGETGGAETDQNFLAQEAAAAKTAAQKAHTPGRHSAKSTSHSAKSTSG